MLIIGAKGFAKEVLEICYQNNDTSYLAFYDDINNDIGDFLFNQFPIINNVIEARNYFENVDNRFAIGIGNPILREMLVSKFSSLGGELTDTRSKFSEIGSFGVVIGKGSNILSGVKISNDVAIGICPLLYYNSVISHDVVIGNFVEISPGATILGGAKIGSFVHLGAGSIIFPGIEIGNNVIIGAGAVVNKNLPNNCVAAGVPAKIIRQK
jgi:sugar O-acyltransferase (sialic acid O-acetyltransferase NeuD family)